VDWDQLTTRIDFNEGANSQWFGRYSWGDEKILNGGNFEIEDRRIITKVDQIMMSNTRTFSPTVVNEFRFGVNFFDNSLETFFNGIRDVTSELGVPGLNPPDEAAWGTPSIGFTDQGSVAGWGEATEAPFINNSRAYQVTDNVSWVRGNHTFRFGGELTVRHYNLIGNQFPRGFFQFGGRATAFPGQVNSTGDSFASGLLGWITEATRSLGLPSVEFRQKSPHLYAEDTWKITPRLTMNIGLRYEFTPPYEDRNRGIMNVQMFCPGVDETGIDEDCRTPVMVRPGEGDFYEGLDVRFADNIPLATGDDVLFNHATIRRSNSPTPAHPTPCLLRPALLTRFANVAGGAHCKRTANLRHRASPSENLLWRGGEVGGPSPAVDSTVYAAGSTASAIEPQ
jgi:hypothetical protein